jgi:ATP phosphoribosyltransferase
MLRLAIPKGSLEPNTRRLLELSGLPLEDERGYRARAGDLAEAIILRAREIPDYVARGYFDAGITGNDLVLESGARVEQVLELGYSKKATAGYRLAFAVAADSPIRTVRDLKGKRLATEYPELAKRWLARRGVKAEVLYSHGATEAKVPWLADAILEIVDTGESLRKNGLRELEEVLRGQAVLVANPRAMRERRDEMRVLRERLAEGAKRMRARA